MELGGILRGRGFSIRGVGQFFMAGGGGLGPWRTLWSTKNFLLRQNLLSLTKIIWNLNRPLPALLSLREDPYCTRRTLLTSISSQSGYIIWRCQMGCRNLLGKFFSMVMMMYHALQIMAKLEPAIIEPFKCFTHSIMDKQNRTIIRTNKTCFKQKL